MEIAKTILEQLGGSRFVVMTGSKNFVAGEKNLSFKVGKNGSKVTHVRITLNSKDLYDMEFLNIRGMKVKTVAECNDVFCDQLQELFTRYTGMYTHF